MGCCFFGGRTGTIPSKFLLKLGGVGLIGWIYRDRRMNVICPTFQFYRGEYLLVGVMQQCGMKVKSPSDVEILSYKINSEQNFLFLYLNIFVLLR